MTSMPDESGWSLFAPADTPRVPLEVLREGEPDVYLTVLLIGSALPFGPIIDEEERVDDVVALIGSGRLEVLFKLRAHCIDVRWRWADKGDEWGQSRVYRKVLH